MSQSLRAVRRVSGLPHDVFRGLTWNWIGLVWSHGRMILRSSHR